MLPARYDDDDDDTHIQPHQLTHYTHNIHIHLILSNRSFFLNISFCFCFDFFFLCEGVLFCTVSTYKCP